ncbi:hypothetical protein ACVINI_000361 [Rhizobium beringeri]|jgi:hypothetical protein
MPDEPLTLTLSPRGERGLATNSGGRGESFTAYLLLPAYGEKCRQVDEGQSQQKRVTNHLQPQETP